MNQGKTGKQIEVDVGRAIQVVQGSTSLLVDEIERMQVVIVELKEVNKTVLSEKSSLETALETANNTTVGLMGELKKIREDYVITNNSLKRNIDKISTFTVKNSILDSVLDVLAVHGLDTDVYSKERVCNYVRDNLNKSKAKRGRKK